MAELSAPGVPRTADGKVNLAAPAPRTPDGRPDLSGVWKSPNADRLEANIAQGPNAGACSRAAQALFDKRLGDVRADSPRARCLPLSVPFHNVFDLLRIVQTPALTVIMYEAPNNVFRTVFTDGRDLPADPNPTWLGYSIGRWDGDTLVITSSGFNDLGWLDFGGHPQSGTLRLTERLHRRDFGHIDVQMTLDDPHVFTKPITVATQLVLQPDTELLESFCDNERDLSHFTSVGNGRGAPRHAEPLRRRVSAAVGQGSGDGCERRQLDRRAGDQRAGAAAAGAIRDAVRVGDHRDGIRVRDRCERQSDRRSSSVRLTVS